VIALLRTAKTIFAMLAAGLAVGLIPGGLQAREPGLLVDPFVGTLADFGQLTPAAVAPYGMVQLAPDTDPANHAGYDFAASQLSGFSHTRAVGVGCGGAGGDVHVALAYVGDPPLAAIDKASERAHAGYYTVTYGGGIRAELTATRGAGAIRFRVPRAGRMRLAVDFARQYTRRHAATWQARANGELQASFSAGTVCDAGIYHLHSATRVMHRGRPIAPAWQGEGARALATLDVRAGDVIELRTGLSSVDPAAAGNVHEAELGTRSFAQIAAATLAQWNRELSRLTIRANTAQQALFYTSLFRVMQTPVAIADPDGRFRGSDGVVGQLPAGEQHYASWAMWDNYRTQMPLLALLDPPRAADIARSLTRLYASGKQRWATPTEPFLTVRTEHAGIALLDFHRKGITAFDARAALAGMVAESPALVRKTPDEQIEAAYDDWAIAELAGDLGDTAIAARHRDLALSYRPMWLATFKELGDDADIVKARGLYQGTLAQYRWAPVFDLPWLQQAMGDRFRPELDRFFAQNLFNMTNQPDIHVPYLLAWAGAPEATTEIVARYLTTPVAHRYTNAGVRPEAFVGPSFALAPQGFADGMDDDAGTMTAWYVWSVLGLYPLTPGDPAYVVASPQVASARLCPAGGVCFAIARAPDGRMLLNGKRIDATRIEHRTLIAPQD
jgi:putative alpha-1,2-mannosidase